MIPEFVDPPQPDADEVGPAPAPPAESESEGAAPSGPGTAPPMGAGMLPGDDPEPSMLRFPPPRRPPWSGVGLFVGAGVTFSAALTEQIIGHVLVKRRCIDPFAEQAAVSTSEDGEAQAEDFGEALLKCAPGILPAFALRVHSDLGLLATIGLAAAGSALRAQRDAHDDAFSDRPPPNKFALQASGVGLIGLGVVTWLTTGAISWGVLASCRTARCATRARLTAFTTRDTGAVMIAAGSGMLAYAMAHRRAYDRFFRDRAMSVGMSWMPGGPGLTLTGRF